MEDRRGLAELLGAVLGAIVFGDFPDIWTIAGAVVIVGSSLYSWQQERRASAARP